MPIKILIQTTGLNVSAVLRDDALVELIRITQEYRSEIQDIPSTTPVPSLTGDAVTPPQNAPGSATTEEEVKRKLSPMAIGELLNQLNWPTYPEKILLLAAWNEAKGQPTPWKKEDIESVFSQAKERMPGNFGREVSNAIKLGLINAETSRTYVVTRSGWNKIAAALK